MMGFKSLLICVICFLFSPCSSSTLQPRAPQSNCTTCAPNPIASIYPKNVTGTINGTTSVIIVPLSYARSLLPSHLAPLPHAYTRFSIPATHYPLVLENTIDHDIRFGDVSPIVDFSSLRISFPFIDLLNDNSTCFKYRGYIYLPPTVPLATSGAEAYGTAAIPATFDPADAPYKHSIPCKDDYLFTVYQAGSQSPGLDSVAKIHDWPSSAANALPLAFYRNVTNQPTFGNKSETCDNFIQFWNTTLSEGENQPQNVRGVVELSPPVVKERTIWRGVEGIRATQAFLENNYVPCESLRGYGGTGAGDSG